MPLTLCHVVLPSTKGLLFSGFFSYSGPLILFEAARVQRQAIYLQQQAGFDEGSGSYFVCLGCVAPEVAVVWVLKSRVEIIPP